MACCSVSQSQSEWYMDVWEQREMANHLQEMRTGKEHLQSTLTGPLLHYLSHTNTQSATCKICPLSTATCGSFTDNVQQIQWIQRTQQWQRGWPVKSKTSWTMNVLRSGASLGYISCSGAIKGNSSFWQNVGVLLLRWSLLKHICCFQMQNVIKLFWSTGLNISGETYLLSFYTAKVSEGAEGKSYSFVLANSLPP